MVAMSKCKVSLKLQYKKNWEDPKEKPLELQKGEDFLFLAEQKQRDGEMKKIIKETISLELNKHLGKESVGSPRLESDTSMVSAYMCQVPEQL